MHIPAHAQEQATLLRGYSSTAVTGVTSLLYGRGHMRRRADCRQDVAAAKASVADNGLVLAHRLHQFDAPAYGSGPPLGMDGAFVKAA